jgi:hypothetical protein
MSKSTLFQCISWVLCSDLFMAMESAVAFTLKFANGVMPFFLGFSELHLDYVSL